MGAVVGGFRRRRGDGQAIRTLLRAGLAFPLLAIGIGATGATSHAGPALPICAQAASLHRVGIVVEHGNGQVVRQCVGFGTTTITALEALEASGIEYATESYGALGAAICQIDHEPARYTTCLPSSGSYWVLFVSRAGGAWTASGQGVSSATLADGDAAGFRYDPLAGADPPPPTPAGTCPVATPTPSPTATPTSTPTAAPTRSPAPTSPPAQVTKSPGATPTPRAGSASSSASSTVPTAEVLGLASPSGTPVNAGNLSVPRTPDDPFTPGLLVAICAIGSLGVLAGVQALRRRRS
jgi:hypothetical protein